MPGKRSYVFCPSEKKLLRGLNCRSIFGFFFLFFIFGAGTAYCLSIKVPEEVFNGEPIPVAIRYDEPVEKCLLKYNGRSLEFPFVSGDENVVWLGAGLGMQGALKIEMEFTGPEGKQTAVREVMIKKKEYPKQHLKLPENMVSFDQKTLNRIYKEKGVIRSALSLITPSRYWTDDFIFPVRGKVLSEFGLRRFMNGKPRSAHRGVDFRAAQGKPIIACNNGRVVLTGKYFFGGNTVVVDHGLGILSLYMHLDKIMVEQGDEIEKGRPVGLAGSTGRATGPHLHFAICIWGEMVNPLGVLKKQG